MQLLLLLQLLLVLLMMKIQSIKPWAGSAPAGPRVNAHCVHAPANLTPPAECRQLSTYLYRHESSDPGGTCAEVEAGQQTQQRVAVVAKSIATVSLNCTTPSSRSKRLEFRGFGFKV